MARNKVGLVAQGLSDPNKIFRLLKTLGPGGWVWPCVMDVCLYQPREGGAQGPSEPKTLRPGGWVSC